jgi:hypothetical protein
LNLPGWVRHRRQRPALTVSVPPPLWLEKQLSVGPNQTGLCANTPVTAVMAIIKVRIFFVGRCPDPEFGFPLILGKPP